MVEVFHAEHQPSKRHARLHTLTVRPFYFLTQIIPLLAKPLDTPDLVDHDIGVVCGHVLLLGLRIVVHLHVVVAASLHLVVLVILAALALNILRASIRGIIVVLGGASSVVGSAHLLILAVGLNLLFFLEVLSGFVRSVGILVIVGQVSVRLVGREFRWSTLLRVPGEMLAMRIHSGGKQT